MHKVTEVEMNKLCVDHVPRSPRLWLVTITEILKMGELIDFNSRLFQNDFQRLIFLSWCFLFNVYLF